MPPFCRSEFAGTSHQEGRLLWVGRTSADAADHRVPVHQKQAWVRICCFSNVVILFRTFPARNAGTGPPTCWLPVAVTRALWVTTPQGLHELDRVLVVRLVRLIRYQRRFVRGNAACVSSRAGLFEQAQHIAVALLPAAADQRELLELFISICFVRRDELDAREEQCAAVTDRASSLCCLHWDQRLPYQDSLNFLHDLVSVCFCRLRSGAFFARDPHCHSL